MSSGEEDEIDNVLIRDIIQSDYDDGEEGSGSEQQVIDDNNACDNNDDIPEDIDNFVDFTAVLSSKKCVTTARRGKENKRKNADVGDGREQEKSYEANDVSNVLPQFIPSRNSGFHHDIPLIRGRLNKAVDFFYLFFTEEMIHTRCKHTNAYAWSRITEKQTYAEKDGSWIEMKPAEFKKLLALIIYFGLVNVNNMVNYWSTKTLYHGLWARNIIPNRDRFKALMAILHVVDFSTEDENDCLRKVCQFTEQKRNRCMDLY